MKGRNASKEPVPVVASTEWPICPTCKRRLPTGVCSKRGCKAAAGRGGR